MNIFVAIPEGIVRDTFLTKENVELLESLGNVRWNETGANLTAEQLRDELPDVDVLVTAWGTPKLEAEVLEKANRLKLLAHTCGSVAHYVTDAMYDRGIRVVCGNEAFASSVAEGTVGYIIAALRNLPRTVQNFAEHGWPTEYKYTQSLLDQNVGIVGYGAISRYLIGFLKPFGVHIKLFSRHTSEEKARELGVEKASLEEIFSTCKIISINSSRTAQNYHMISDELLGMLKPDCLLVNTSRGDLIDEAAMAKHLRQNHFRAILDVYEVEPLPMDSPLRGLENAILIPHQGGPTTDRRAVAARLVIDDIRNMIEGRPLENEISASRATTMTH